MYEQAYREDYDDKKRDGQVREVFLAGEVDDRQNGSCVRGEDEDRYAERHQPERPTGRGRRKELPEEGEEVLSPDNDTASMGDGKGAGRAIKKHKARGFEEKTYHHAGYKNIANQALKRSRAVPFTMAVYHEATPL